MTMAMEVTRELQGAKQLNEVVSRVQELARMLILVAYVDRQLEL
jgi:hypothetical protein